MANDKEMHSVIHYDDFDEHITVELNISTRFILTNQGVKDLHDLYFDTIHKTIEDVREMQE